jgi:hypothetical protein
MTRKHFLWWLPATCLAATCLAVSACKSARPSGRSITVGDNITLELRFEDPLVLTVESQAADGRSWQPLGYLTMTRGTGQVTMARPQAGNDLRFTLGVAGKLMDRADGSTLGDGNDVVVQSQNPRAVDVREARIATQLQVAPGTIATIELDEAAKTTLTTTRPFQR